nr:reverse transcriptase domain-containing protein [Tanacetum cinerariifolium]
MKTVAFTAEGSSTSDTDKIMARMDAMTMKMDAQYKDFQSRSKKPNLDDDDIPMSHEEKAKFMQTFRRTQFYIDYRDHDSSRDNWRSSQRNDYNRDNYQSHSDDKPDLQKHLKVGKFTFPADFVILEMEEDSKLPLILGKPFLHTADANYTITVKELMVVVFAFEKFQSYLVLSKMIMHSDHSALRPLFNKQDAKPRLIRWIMLLQKFDIKIKDRKCTENVAADHLSQIENEETSDDCEVDDDFPRETLIEINIEDDL